MLTEHQIPEQERDAWKASAQANRAELDIWYAIAREADVPQWDGERYSTTLEWAQRVFEAVARREWQPIETAPLNQSILVYLPNWDHYGHAVYRAMLVDMGTGKHWITTAWASGRDLSAESQPTHWMPLPEPPHDEDK